MLYNLIVKSQSFIEPWLWAVTFRNISYPFFLPLEGKGGLGVGVAGVG